MPRPMAALQPRCHQRFTCLLKRSASDASTSSLETPNQYDVFLAPTQQKARNVPHFGSRWSCVHARCKQSVRKPWRVLTSMLSHPCLDVDFIHRVCHGISTILLCLADAPEHKGVADVTLAPSAVEALITLVRRRAVSHEARRLRLSIDLLLRRTIIVNKT